MTRTLPVWTRSTDIRDLLECQMKWLLKRLFDMDFQATWFPLGTGVHKGIYDMLAGNGELEATIEGVSDLINEMLAAAVATGLPIRGTKRRTTETIFADAERMLRKWYASVMEAGNREYAALTMENVSCEVVVSVPAEAIGGLAPMRTTVDAIFPLHDQTDVDYAIVDWKSGATASASPLQLHTYLFALRNDPNSPLWHIPPERVEMWFHHIDFSKIQRVENYPGDDYIRTLIQWTEATKQRMRDTGFAPAHPDWYCDYCVSRSHCPAWGANLGNVTRGARMLTLDFVPIPDEQDESEV